MKSLWILCFALILQTQVACAQERVDKVTPVLTKKSVRTGPMTGWTIDEETRKWISHLGYIGDSHTRAANAAAFNWLQTGRFDYEGHPYFVFFYEAPWGYYTYPALREGWNPTVEYRYSVMSLSDYARLVKLADKEGIAKAYAYVGSTIAPYSETRLIADIINNIRSVPNAYEKANPSNGLVNAVTLKIQTLKDKKVVRFDPTAAVYNSEEEYFETDLATFKSLLLPLTAGEQRIADSIIALDPAPKDMGTVQSADDVKKAAEEFERQQAEAKQRVADEAAKRQAEEATYTAKKREDSIAKATAITDWVASPQLASGACSWQHTGSGKVPFDYMEVISFRYKGIQKYCFRYHMPGAFMSSDREYALLVLNAAQYDQIKNALKNQDNTLLSVSSTVNAFTYPSYGTEKMLVDLLADPGYASYGSCLDIIVKKGKTKFRLPTEGCATPDSFTKPDARGYYECDTKDFARLFAF